MSLSSVDALLERIKSNFAPVHLHTCFWPFSCYEFFCQSVARSFGRPRVGFIFAKEMNKGSMSTNYTNTTI